MTSTEALQQDITQRRLELAQTVDQLADKLNVKAQASAKVEPYRVPLAVGGGSLVALLVVLRLRKHRSS